MTGPSRAASAGARALVLVAAPLDVDEHEVGGDDGHHLARVRRLRPGEPVVLADGAGSWRPGEVVAVDGARVVLRCTGPVRAEPVARPPVTVAFAPARSDRGAEVVRQLTELGVDRIVPLVTERGVVRWDGADGARARARLVRVAREAAMQCHRPSVPEVGEPVEVGALAAGGGAVLVGAADGAALDRPIDGRPVTVATGPEGGFTPEERRVLGGRAVAVGPHVLRAVTAPVALASVVVAARAAWTRIS